MADEPPSITSLLRLAFDSHRDEYREWAENWRNLDTKTQGLVTIAGIFLAAVFAWSRSLPATSNWCQGLFLVGSIVLLVAAVILAALALWVRTVPVPPFGEETGEMIEDVLRESEPDELPDLVADFYRDQMKVWRDTNSELAEHCASKASRIKFGQIFLLVAAVLVAILAVAPTLQTLSGGGR